MYVEATQQLKDPAEVKTVAIEHFILNNYERRHFRNSNYLQFWAFGMGFLRMSLDKPSNINAVSQIFLVVFPNLIKLWRI